MSHERVDRRRFLITTGLKVVGGIATVAATADALNYYWINPHQDPLYQKDMELRRQKKVLAEQIVQSRDARENAIQREQIEIIDRDLWVISHDQVEQMGPILSRTRPLGVLLGIPISLGLIAYTAPYVIRESLIRLGSGLRSTFQFRG